MEAVIFGAGAWCKGLKKGLEKYFGVHICAIFDNDETRWGEKIDNVVISPPEKLIDTNFEKVFVCVRSKDNWSAIEKQLVNMGIPQEKIVIMATNGEYADAFLEIYDIGSLVQQNCILTERVSTLRKNLLTLQRRLRKYETFNEWEYIEHFGKWEARSFAMSHHIKTECKSLLDLGCGEMHIRKFLNDGIKYYGCDYKKRDEETIICDLAKGEFPSICVDTIFIAGVLEYLVNWRDVLKKCSQHCTQLVMSYNTVESCPNRADTWVNSISYQEIVDEMLQNGFKLVDKESRPDIFNFEKDNG